MNSPVVPNLGYVGPLGVYNGALQDHEQVLKPASCSHIHRLLGTFQRKAIGPDNSANVCFQIQSVFSCESISIVIEQWGFAYCTLWKMTSNC